MEITRLTQKTEGNNFHYILTNQFESEKKIVNTENFILNFLKSEYYKSHSKVEHINSLPENEQKNFLPFPFNFDELSFSDFNKVPKNLTKHILEIANKELNEFDNYEAFIQEIGHNLEYIDKSILENESNMNFYFLSLYDFKNDSTKINSLYNEMNFIHDYFYFIFLIDNSRTKIWTIELGYE